jgi:hypothetical protein
MRLIGYENVIWMDMYNFFWFIYREAGVAIAMTQLLTPSYWIRPLIKLFNIFRHSENRSSIIHTTVR